jgi:hypothetical protein
VNYFYFCFVLQKFQDFHLIFYLKIAIRLFGYFNLIFVNSTKVLALSLHIPFQIVKNQLINTKKIIIMTVIEYLILLNCKIYITYLSRLIFIYLFNLNVLTPRNNCSKIFSSIIFNTYNWFPIFQTNFLPFIFLDVFEIIIQNAFLRLQFKRFSNNIFIVSSRLWNNASISI